jgi:hypothetical protein
VFAVAKIFVVRFYAHGEETFVVRGTPQSYTARQRVFFPVVIAPTEFFL